MSIRMPAYPRLPCRTDPRSAQTCWYISAPMGERQLFRLRTRSDREIIRDVDPGKVYVDRETGEEYEVVGKVLPLAPSPSNQPWSVENLRLCGCSLEQLTPKDVNDCVHCGRRLPALDAPK